MSLPPILVINLERSKERRAHMEEELGRFGVDYSFYPGLDGHAFTQEEWKLVSQRECIVHMGTVLYKSEAGNAITHARIYEKMLKEGMEELLILEDDVQLNDVFFEALKRRQQWLPSAWGIVNFSYAYGLDATPKDLFTPVCKIDISGSALELIQIRKYHNRTSCYLLTLPAATRLLSLAYPIRRGTDILLGDIPFHQLDCYTVLPALAKIGSFSSTMNTAANRLSRIWRNLPYVIAYKDTRKPFFKLRIKRLKRRLRKVYRWLLRR